MEQSWPDGWGEDYGGSVDHQADQQYRQDGVPEPDENVRFLVHDVQRQDAQGVVLLYGSRCTILVENAFGDAWKNVDHRINAFLLRHVG